MPNIGFGEILVILLIGLIIFGPRRLPEMGRTVGKSLRDFRRAAEDLKAEIESDADDDKLPRVPSPADQREPSPERPKPGEAPPT